MPTIGAFSVMSPVEPKNFPDPNVNTPPSEATNQYPSPAGTRAPPTTSQFSGTPAAEPLSTALPWCDTPPPRPGTIEYPSPAGVGSTPATSARIVSACAVPPSPTHSQCHGSGHVLPLGSAHPGWFQPTRYANDFKNL